MPDKTLRPATPRKIDATNITDGPSWNSKPIPNGLFKQTIRAVHETDTNDGDPMWVFTCSLDQRPNYTYPYRCPLTPNALGFLSALYRAVGVELPKKVQTRDPNKLVGKKIGTDMVVDEYQADKGRDASKIDSVLPVADVADEPSLDGQRPAQQARTATTATRRTPSTEPPAEDDTEDLEGLDLDDLDL